MSQMSSEVIKDTDLDEWRPIGSGGFGSVWKVRHKTWRLDLAVKLLHNTSSPAEIKDLNTEANHMKSLFFEFVVRLYGTYDGTPSSEEYRRRGLVMEYMRRGSIETLQKEMAGPPPLPLAFRLAHQVALGMNFLHSKGVLHCDLKPSNVLLTDEFNAKLADFGLSRVSASVLDKRKIPSEEVGGTYKYMPPEAFDLSYEPVRSFDIYSYGILLWSIVTGQEPYRGKFYSLVEMLIRRGGRPKVDFFQKQEQGMKELVTLMTQCWDGNPKNRPKSEDITKDTEGLFLKHKCKVDVAVHKVLLELDSQSGNSQANEAAGASPRTPENALLNDVVDNSRVFTQHVQGFGGASTFPGCQPIRNVIRSEQMIGPSQVQHVETLVQPPGMDAVTPMTSDRVCLTQSEKAKFVDDKKPVIVQRASRVMAVVEVLGNKVHQESYSEIRAEITSQDQMRALYDGPLRSGGEPVKAAFYDFLKIHEQNLMEDLGG
ncbi:receptor-interacting serine/threonine-protein kinase 3 [Nothobranchius furzeri]|uniref:Transcript variant X3 n=1 Tax=Nothobranchius furzeri TaxID=105023 RepID=A0A9D2YS55_NOTFU|nr:transcript variant X3 [Nothobranchius furzeri]